MGERESDAKALGGGISAYRLALLELTDDRAPTEKAATEKKLATALRLLEQHDTPPWLRASSSGPRWRGPHCHVGRFAHSGPTSKTTLALDHSESLPAYVTRAPGKCRGRRYSRRQV
jgi:hypothetical protein